MKTILLFALVFSFFLNVHAQSVSSISTYEVMETKEAVEFTFQTPTSVREFLLGMNNKINDRKILSDTEWVEIGGRIGFAKVWPWEDSLALNRPISGTVMLPKDPGKVDSTYKVENIIVCLSAYAVTNGRPLWPIGKQVTVKTDVGNQSIGYSKDEKYLIWIEEAP